MPISLYALARFRHTACPRPVAMVSSVSAAWRRDSGLFFSSLNACIEGCCAKAFSQQEQISVPDNFFPPQRQTIPS
ncbi:MAG: hypothetical protein Q7U44_00475 [Desulfuromonadales bacterium]|nr:hypothetical protein [Desulfuromonadales bacterium]